MPTDVATALPQLHLRENSILTVTLDDPNALITRLVIHGWQSVAGTTTELDTFPLLLPVTDG
jgi:hypothetical protein